MPRRPEVDDQPLTKTVTMKMNARMVRVLDEMRDEATKGAFIRDLVRAEYQRRQRN